MMRFLTIRGLQALLVVFGMSFLIYLMLGLMPGDPVDMMLAGNPNATAEDANRLRAIYGLDKPIYERYFLWIINVLQGDFGYSRLYTQPVWDLIWPRFANTFVLLGLSLGLSIAIAIPLGAYAAKYRGGKFDNTANLLSFAGLSVPPFWLAIVLIIIFSVTYQVLPAGGTAPPNSEGIHVKYLILPVFALTFATIGKYIRHVRSATLQALTSDHIRTARAKGVSEFKVLWRHAMPMAMIPVTTLIALDFGTLFGGAVITETIFAWPGTGKLIYDAILGNDYNLALVTLLFLTITIMIGNILADILYTALDPRISFDGETS